MAFEVTLKANLDLNTDAAKRKAGELSRTLAMYSARGTSQGTFQVSESTAARNPGIFGAAAPPGAGTGGTGGGSYRGPKPPVIPPGKPGGSTAGAMAGALGLTSLTSVLAAMYAELRLIRNIVNNSYNIYVKAAQSGLSTQFFTQRQVLANVLGVSGNPNQVFMFGNAVKYVQERTAHATAVLSGTARTLANVGINARILQTDASALGAKLLTEVAPALESFIYWLDRLVVFLTNNIKVLMMLTPEYWLQKGESAIANKIAGGKVGDQINKAPGLNLYPLQLPASPWEKMGLVIGNMNGPVDYARRTARATEKTTTILEKMQKNYSKLNEKMGLSPNTANP